MVVAGVPTGLSQRAPSEGPFNAHSLLRLDSWRLPAANIGPGRVGSEVFIDTDRAPPTADSPFFQTLFSAPSENDGFNAVDPFLLNSAAADANDVEKFFQEYPQNGAPRGAAGASTSAPSRQSDDEPAGKFSFSQQMSFGSQDEKEWSRMFGEADETPRDLFGGPASRPSAAELQLARARVAAAKAVAERAAEESAKAERTLEFAAQVESIVKQKSSTLSQPFASQPIALSPAGVVTPAAATAALVARRKPRGVNEVAEALQSPLSAPQSRASLPPQAMRRTPQAPAANALKRASALSSESSEPPVKKQRTDFSLASLETPITDAALRSLAVPNTVKATDHWLDPSGRKCRRGCLHCGLQKTPQWRMGPLGPKTLCNACGVRYRKEVEIEAARKAAREQDAAVVQ